MLINKLYEWSVYWFKKENNAKSEFFSCFSKTDNRVFKIAIYLDRN